MLLNRNIFAFDLIDSTNMTEQWMYIEYFICVYIFIKDVDAASVREQQQKEGEGQKQWQYEQTALLILWFFSSVLLSWSKSQQAELITRNATVLL